MNAVADSTIIVAALSSWHVKHDQAAERLQEISIAISHTLAETFSTMTRLPRGRRINPKQIQLYLQNKFTTEIYLNSYRYAIAELTNCGVSGGATYDGLIALVARNANLKLLTLDKRASRTYEAVGVEYELLN